MLKNIFITSLIALCTLLFTGCETTQHILNQGFSSSSGSAAQSAPVNLQGFPNGPIFWQGGTATVWNKLQHIPLTELQSASAQATQPDINGWLKLAIISKQYSTDTSRLASELMAWRSANPGHPANALFPDNGTLTRLQNSGAPAHIALLLPLQGELGTSGQAVRDGFLSAYYGSPVQRQQTVSFIDTTQNPNMSALYQKALSEGATSVIGPLTKENVQQLLGQSRFPVPTLALNYTDIWFGSLPANFYEFGLSPLDEAKQLAEKSWASGHKKALLIAPDDSWGQRVVKSLTANWQTLGGSVTDTFYFNSKTDLNLGIAELLHANPNNNKREQNIPEQQQRRQDFDIIFLLAPPQTARQIVPLLKYYYAANVPIYATSVVYSGAPSAEDSDLNGVTFADMPWTLQNANPSPIKSNAKSSRLYALGRDAYMLNNQFSRLSILPNFPIYGATGALTLTPQQQIYRRLAWVQMHNGRP
ncbi:MAG TPA: penicillin-binding protein activator [Gammaproteobacteria bacterium]|nr:penicillin-binding protein activator [Gammaproteobacteria bacterium]